VPRSIRAPAALVLAAVLGAAHGPAASAALRVPRGVTVRTVARGVPFPSNVAFDARGRMWLTSASFSRHGGDGVWFVGRPGARPRHVVRGLRSALGLTWSGGRLYVAAVVRRGASERARVFAFDHFDGRRFHHRHTVWRGPRLGVHRVGSIAAGPDGRLYLGIGSLADARRGADPRLAAVVSFDRRGRGTRVEARGLRNPYGLAFVTGRRWLLLSDNGRDRLGEGVPPDELNLLALRGHRRAIPSFGFPRCYDQGGAACRGTRAPLARLAPHAGVAGVAYAPRFGCLGPSAFVAENGSSLRRRPTGSDVVRVRLVVRRGHVRGVRSRFATGFAEFDPVGAAIGPGGALYVTLYGTGRVVRFAAPRRRGTGCAAATRPAVERHSTKG
jgi:glucose/arabinose dehydrogenase